MSHHSAGAAADGLDNDVLSQAVLLSQGRGKAHRDDGNGDGRFEHLAHLQSQIGRGGRKEHHHQDAHRHRIEGYFLK